VIDSWTKAESLLKPVEFEGQENPRSPDPVPAFLQELRHPNATRTGASPGLQHRGFGAAAKPTRGFDTQIRLPGKNAEAVPCTLSGPVCCLRLGATPESARHRTFGDVLVAIEYDHRRHHGGGAREGLAKPWGWEEVAVYFGLVEGKERGEESAVESKMKVHGDAVAAAAWEANGPLDAESSLQAALPAAAAATEAAQEDEATVLLGNTLLPWWTSLALATLVVHLEHDERLLWRRLAQDVAGKEDLVGTHDEGGEWRLQVASAAADTLDGDQAEALRQLAGESLGLHEVEEAAVMAGGEGREGSVVDLLRHTALRMGWAMAVAQRHARMRHRLLLTANEATAALLTVAHGEPTQQQALALEGKAVLEGLARLPSGLASQGLLSRLEALRPRMVEAGIDQGVGERLVGVGRALEAIDLAWDRAVGQAELRREAIDVFDGILEEEETTAIPGSQPASANHIEAGRFTRLVQGDGSSAEECARLHAVIEAEQNHDTSAGAAPSGGFTVGKGDSHLTFDAYWRVIAGDGPDAARARLIRIQRDGGVSLALRQTRWAQPPATAATAAGTEKARPPVAPAGTAVLDIAAMLWQCTAGSTKDAYNPATPLELGSSFCSSLKEAPRELVFRLLDLDESGQVDGSELAMSYAGPSRRLLEDMKASKASEVGGVASHLGAMSEALRPLEGQVSLSDWLAFLKGLEGSPTALPHFLRLVVLSVLDSPSSLWRVGSRDQDSSMASSAGESRAKQRRQALQHIARVCQPLNTPSSGGCSWSGYRVLATLGEDAPARLAPRRAVRVVVHTDVDAPPPRPEEEDEAWLRWLRQRLDGEAKGLLPASALASLELAATAGSHFADGFGAEQKKSAVATCRRFAYTAEELYSASEAIPAHGGGPLQTLKGELELASCLEEVSLPAEEASYAGSPASKTPGGSPVRDPCPYIVIMSIYGN